MPSAPSPVLSPGTNMTNGDSGTDWSPTAIEPQTAPIEAVGTVVGPQALPAVDPAPSLAPDPVSGTVDTTQNVADDDGDDDDDDDDDNVSTESDAAGGGAGSAAAPAPAPAPVRAFSAGYAKMLRRQLTRPVDPVFVTSMLKRNLKRQVGARPFPPPSKAANGPVSWANCVHVLAVACAGPMPALHADHEEYDSADAGGFGGLAH